MARVRGTIAENVSRIWPVLADFGRPQRLAPSITACEATGAGVGALRVVRARGMIIHERLETFDPAAFRLSYRVLPSGDMPAPGVRSYVAEVTLYPVSSRVTDVEWSSQGEIDGSHDVIRSHFQALYERAIANLAVEAARSGG